MSIEKVIQLTPWAYFALMLLGIQFTGNGVLWPIMWVLFIIACEAITLLLLQRKRRRICATTTEGGHR